MSRSDARWFAFPSPVEGELWLSPKVAWEAIDLVGMERVEAGSARFVKAGGDVVACIIVSDTDPASFARLEERQTVESLYAAWASQLPAGGGRLVNLLGSRGWVFVDSAERVTDTENPGGPAPSLTLKQFRDELLAGPAREGGLPGE